MAGPAPTGACHCGCREPSGVDAHRIVNALAVDDLDLAIERGLLGGAACGRCSPACRNRLLSAEETRRAALASRERVRARHARLARRRQERSPPGETTGTPRPGASSPALPPAAAAALARARAKAAVFPGR